MVSDHDSAVDEITSLLETDGWVVARSFFTDESGQPHLKEPDSGGVPSPDLHATDPSNDRNDRWIEVKWRKQAIVYEKADEERHGIEIPEWESHNECLQTTGLPVWIFIVEDSTGHVLRQRIRSLSPVQTTKKMWTDAGGAVLFPRDQFERLGSRDPFDMDASVQSGLSSF